MEQEVDSLVRPSHRSININWIEHQNSAVKDPGWELNGGYKAMGMTVNSKQ